MDREVVLITGASKGLGLHLASRLSNEKNIVYGAARNWSSSSRTFKPLYLDLTNEKSIEKCVEELLQAEKKIDVIVHSAGIAYIGPLESLTINELKELFEVNFFGALRLTQLILPHMRNRNKGKIIFISSIRAIESCAYLGAYSASKAAIEAAAFDLSVSLAQWNIKVSVIEPGPINTDMQMKTGSYFIGAKNPYSNFPSFELEWESPQNVCDVICKAIETSEPAFSYQTSEAAMNTISKHLRDPSRNQWLYEQKKWFYSHN